MEKKEGRDGGRTKLPSFFIRGIAFIPVGVIWMTVAFTINASLFPTGLPLLSLGIIYLSIGLGNRDKWKKS